MSTAANLWQVRALESIAMESHDPDTKTACLIVRADGLSIGAANRIPDGVRKEPRRCERPDKYDWIQHAEARAISTAARQGLCLSGANLWLNWFPCAACASLIVQAGVKCVVANKARYEERVNDPRYGFAEAAQMFAEAGVAVSFYDGGVTV